MHRGATIDNEDTAGVVLAQYLFEKRIVLETADRCHGPGEAALVAEPAELCVAAADSGTDVVDEIGGGDRRSLFLG